jgi:hypothetical protein
MTLKEKLRQPGTMMKIGLVFLVLANLSHRFLRPGGDFVFGILMGLAIGCLLVSVRRRVQPKVNGD